MLEQPSNGRDRNGTKEAGPQKDTDPSTSEPTKPTSHTASAPVHRVSAHSDKVVNIDSEIDKMIAAVQGDTRNIQAEEFPTRKRTKHSWSERAVPFPNNGVKKIMKTEEFIITELKRRSSCQIESDCNSKSEKCKNDSGCCEKHPPNPFNFKAECGLLMGKASELIAKRSWPSGHTTSRLSRVRLLFKEVTSNMQFQATINLTFILMLSPLNRRPKPNQGLMSAVMRSTTKQTQRGRVGPPQ